ncbi:MAG: FUSC family protein [Rhodomicrobium sp.]
MTAWLVKNRVKLQFALRMTFAALASYGLGEALGLAQTYWAVLSSVIVIQGSVGGSLRAGINRLIGTVGGAFWGAAVALLIPHDTTAALAVALFVAIAPLAILTGFRPDYRVAPITAIIVQMAPSLMQSDPVTSAVSRVFEISLGSAVAIAVAYFILPARAHSLLAQSATAVVAAMAELVSLFSAALCSGTGAAEIFKVQNKIRAGIAQTELRASEAAVERANRLSAGPDPEPLARTLRRLRHDLAMIARALGTPFSEPVKQHIEAPLSAIFSALGAWLAADSQALAAGKPAPNLEAVKAAIETYKRAVAGNGQQGLSYQAGNNDVVRAYTLLFTFEQTLQNLEDLADRTSEFAEDA